MSDSRRITRESKARSAVRRGGRPERHHDHCSRPLDDSHDECPIRGDLAIGAEAFVIVSTPVGRSKTRRKLEGSARVRVIDPHVDGRHNVFRVVVIMSRSVAIGRELEVPRGALYNCNELVECQAFRDEVARFWPSAPATTAGAW